MADETQDAEVKKALEQVRASFPDREVEAVEFDMGAGKPPLFFILTAPDRDEWKKFRSELRKSKNDDDAAENAIERAALAMIRWPERTEVQRIFNRKPGMIGNFAEVISRLAGVDAEAREKKL